MTKNFLFALGLLCLSSVASFAQNKRTVLSATIDGYKRDMVYFDCVQTVSYTHLTLPTTERV